MHRRIKGPCLLFLCLLTVLWVAEKSAAADDSAVGGGASAAAIPVPAYAAHAIGEWNPDALPPAAKRQLGFFARLAAAYKEDWHPTAAAGPAAPRRGYPAPLNSPPFPSSDWSVGGTPLIGTEDTSAYPLVTALYGGRHGEALKASRVKIYGWLNPGFNVSTSNKDKFANLPAAYAWSRTRSNWTRPCSTSSVCRIQRRPRISTGDSA